MNKKLKILLTLLLILTMLFGVMSTTVLAAAGSTEDTAEKVSSTGNLDTGWCEITYNSDGVTVTLNPDVKSLLDVNEEEIKEVVDILIDAAKAIVFEDVKNDVLDANSSEEPQVFSLKSTPATESGELLDFKGIWFSALNAFVGGRYGDTTSKEYTEFIEDILADNTSNAPEDSENTTIEDFIDHVCEIIEIAVGLGVDVDQLPEATEENLVSSIIDAFDISEEFEEFFEITKEDAENRLEELAIPAFLEKYDELRQELLETPEVELNYADLIKYISLVSVDGITLYEDGTVDAEALKELATTIPTPSEIANMANEEMQLSYSFLLKTTMASSTDFTVTVRLGGGYEKVRKLAALISEYVDVSLGKDNTLILDVEVPAKFSKLVLKAANSDKVPEELKKKVFAAFEKTPDDVYALYNDVTLDELLKIFDYVDFEEIITSDYLKDFESLEGLTEEQIKNKIEEYEEQYEKLIALARRIYNNNVPDSIKNKTIFSLYDGNGKFSFAGSKTVNVENVLNKFSEKYGALIASFLDFTTVTARVDAEIEFQKINKVTYVVDGNIHSTGLLPEGADLAYFAGITEHDGKPITEWLGDDGIVYSKMPDKDVVLTAQFEVIPEPEISVSDDVDKTYDGQTVNITATVRGEIPEGIEVTYQWYKKTTPTSEPTKLEGKTGNTLTLLNVSDSGLYYCEVTLTGSSGSFVKVTTDAVNVNIRKAVINLSDYHWYSEPFVYDGTVKEVYLVDANGNRLNIFGVKYAGASGIKAGNYKARVELLDYYNFEFSEETQPSEFMWTIDKATVDMSGVTFKNKTVKYDGFAHSLSISGVLPEGVVSVEYSENSFTEPGVYTVTAVFTVDDNYNPIPDMSAKLTILGFKNQYEIIDTDKNLIVRIESEQGVWENHILNFKDVSVFYASFDFGSFFGEGYRGVLGGAYDLHFAEDGTQQKTTGNFTVRLLIPVNLRNSTNPLKVAHISENGDVEDMNATVDGNYMVFNTTHFSVYSIVEVVTDDSLPPSDDGKDNAWIWILLAILTLLIIVAIVIFVIARRKPKDTGPAPETENTADPEPVDEPVIEQTAEEPVVEEPTEEEPTIQEPTIEEMAIEEPVAEESVADAPAAPVITLTGNDSGEAIINGEVVHVRYRTSFMSRLIQSGDVMQDYYTALKNALLSYKGVKARGSWNFESFNKGREQCAKLNVKGNALQLYLALDPKEYNANKYHFTDVSDKPKLDKVPMMLKVKSERGLKYAFELIEEMMNKLGIEKTEEPKNDYRMPYETTEELAARGLVKIILPAGVELDGDENLVKVNVGELLDNAKAGADVADSEVATEEPVAEAAEIEEAAADVPAIEEQAVVEPVADAPAAPVITLTGNDSGEAIINGEVVHVRYRTSFMSRLIQSGDVIQDYYTALKNALLSYKGVKARGSWNFESFNKGRVQCAKLNVKGSALQVYLALDPNEYSVTKYHFTDVSDKPKLDKVPMMLKVKSARGLKSALELVDEMMSKLGIEKGKASELDFHMPYETTEELAARELVKVILPKGVKLDGDENLVKINVGELLDNAKAVTGVQESEFATEEPVAEAAEIEEAAADVPAEEILHLDATHADEILSDEEAVSKIEVVERVPGEKGQGKLFEINLDTICENFEDGEAVTLEALKAKKLVNKNAGRIKVLARGVMTKNLTVYADKFSLQAVKMITLAGGHADQYK